MKLLFFIMFIASSLFGGFFADETNATKKEILENKRLCKIFKAKAEKYKLNMRDDDLAKATLVSYEHRAALFCSKSKNISKETH